MSEPAQLIVYACPTGLLAGQIDAFYERSRAICGPNRAHDYMPHCTVTGFFRDMADAIPLYCSALDEAFFHSAGNRPAPLIAITGMPLLPDWLGLTLEAEEVRQRVAHFARIADSPTRKEALRLKDNLHLSLAYEFPVEQHETLAAMAAEMIDPASPVGWDLRFYQRHPDNAWTCHYSRPL